MIWELLVTPLSKKGFIFTNLGQGLSKKFRFFFTFEPILSAGFFDKMLALSIKKSTVVFVAGFFGCCIFTFLFKYYLKGCFQTKKAP